MRDDYSISCDSSRRAAVVLYAGLMVCVYPLGVPLAYAVLLRRRRDRLNPPVDRGLSRAAALEAQLAARDGDPTIKALTFLFDVYEPEYWWWEIYESLRRVACTGVLVLFPVNSVLQLNLAIFLQLQG